MEIKSLEPIHSVDIEFCVEIAGGLGMMCHRRIWKGIRFGMGCEVRVGGGWAGMVGEAN